jgi:hypothetical protein
LLVLSNNKNTKKLGEKGMGGICILEIKNTTNLEKSVVDRNE